MNSFRCIAVDDNELDRLTISSYLAHFPEIDVLGIYQTPQDALKAIRMTSPDIVFLDVDMRGMTGLELRKEILDVPVCIFTTDHPEYAVDSFELETLDYLLKPYSLERFSKTIERINEYMEIRKKADKFENKEEKNSFFVKDGHKKVKIEIEEVLYLNALQNYTIIITEKERYYVLSPLSSLLNDDNFQSFVRTHRSYAVNKKHIKTIDSKGITLKNNEQIPIGRSYKKLLDL